MEKGTVVPPGEALDAEGRERVTPVLQCRARHQGARLQLARAPPDWRLGPFHDTHHGRVRRRCGAGMAEHGRRAPSGTILEARALTVCF
jgi:hypothetical protein